MIKRIINTHSTELDLNREYILSDITHEGIKPTGLWYALGNEWIDWCEGNMNEEWIRPSIIEIELLMNKVLIVETIEDVENLIKKYSKELFPGSSLFNIDWEALASEYSGIEIRNYNHLKWGRRKDIFKSKTEYRIDDLWLSAWDVSSGCIWDLSIIKSHKCYSLQQFKNENKKIS